MGGFPVRFAVVSILVSESSMFWVSDWWSYCSTGPLFI